MWTKTTAPKPPPSKGLLTAEKFVHGMNVTLILTNYQMYTVYGLYSGMWQATIDVQRYARSLFVFVSPTWDTSGGK